MPPQLKTGYYALSKFRRVLPMQLASRLHNFCQIGSFPRAECQRHHASIEVHEWGLRPNAGVSREVVCRYRLAKCGFIDRGQVLPALNSQPLFL